ncbi:hypothetical protein ABKA04_001741 [Annulohypoxylon sp. FPYF3050]
MDEYLRRIDYCLEEIAQFLNLRTNDASSVYSVDAEAVSLRYLSLSLQAVNEPHKRSKEDALLDTGATACAISASVALRLNLNVEETEKTVFKTAAQDEELAVTGRVYLNLRWKNNEEERFGTRMWVYVVYSLTHPMLLSHQFTQKHPEAWDIAKTVTYLPKQLNVLFFHKQTKQQKKAEEVYQAQCLQRNAAIADAQKRERLSEQDRLLAISTQNLVAGPSAVSTSGSVPGQTSISSISSTASTSTTPNPTSK